MISAYKSLTLKSPGSDFMELRLKRLYLLILLLFPLLAVAQQTKVTGKVTDELTNEPIPFATIVFKNTTIGANTDFDGKYTLVTETPGDSIICTLVGYKTVRMRVKKGQEQVINIVMKVAKTEMQEVVVKAGENPANIILKKVIKHKDINDPNKLETYQYEVYNKLEFDMTNISDKMKKNKLLKELNLLKEYLKKIFKNLDRSLKIIFLFPKIITSYKKPLLRM